MNKRLSMGVIGKCGERGSIPPTNFSHDSSVGRARVAVMVPGLAQVQILLVTQTTARRMVNGGGIDSPGLILELIKSFMGSS